MKEDDLIRNINPFGLRMQPSLKARVEDSAQANHRSLNAEITARLEESFSPSSTKPLTVMDAINFLMDYSRQTDIPIQVIIGESDEDEDEDGD